MKQRLLLIAVFAITSACQRPSSPIRPAQASPPSRRDAPASAAESDEAPRWPSPPDAQPLLEDPDRGKRSEEQWRAHLAEEDRERLMARDRHARKHHEAILRMLAHARQTYVRARSEAKILAAKAQVAELRPKIEEALSAINTWGNVSPLTATYQEMLGWLEAAIPDARLAALRGDGARMQALRRDWDDRLQEIRKHLREAAERGREGE